MAEAEGREGGKKSIKLSAQSVAQCGQYLVDPRLQPTPLLVISVAIYAVLTGCRLQCEL